MSHSKFIPHSTSHLMVNVKAKMVIAGQHHSKHQKQQRHGLMGELSQTSSCTVYPHIRCSIAVVCILKEKETHSVRSSDIGERLNGWGASSTLLDYSGAWDGTGSKSQSIK